MRRENSRRSSGTLLKALPLSTRPTPFSPTPRAWRESPSQAGPACASAQNLVIYINQLAGALGGPRPKAASPLSAPRGRDPHSPPRRKSGNRPRRAGCILPMTFADSLPMPFDPTPKARCPSENSGPPRRRQVQSRAATDDRPEPAPTTPAAPIAGLNMRAAETDLTPKRLHDATEAEVRSSVEGLAEGAGFEPAIRFPAYTLSRRAPSAARPPLLDAALACEPGA